MIRCAFAFYFNEKFKTFQVRSFSLDRDSRRVEGMEHAARHQRGRGPGDPVERVRRQAAGDGARPRRRRQTVRRARSDRQIRAAQRRAVPRRGHRRQAGRVLRPVAG